METSDYISNFNVLFMVTAVIACILLFIWLSLLQSKRNMMMSVKTYVSSEDLINDLRKTEKGIPCAILRGYVRERNLKILDHSYEGVLRQTETEEVYEWNEPQTNSSGEEEISFFDVRSRIRRYFGFTFRSSSNSELQDKVTTIDDLESVDFGLVELVGNKWLVEDMGPPEDYVTVMRKTSTDVTYLNCNNAIGGSYQNPIIRPRTLIKVTNVVHMLVIGEPITIVGEVTVNDYGNIQISRGSKPTDCGCGFSYGVSNKTPEALSKQDETNERCILCGIFVSVCIGLYGAYRFLQEDF